EGEDLGAVDDQVGRRLGGLSGGSGRGEEQEGRGGRGEGGSLHGRVSLWVAAGGSRPRYPGYHSGAGNANEKCGLRWPGRGARSAAVTRLVSRAPVVGQRGGLGDEPVNVLPGRLRSLRLPPIDTPHEVLELPPVLLQTGENGLLLRPGATRPAPQPPDEQHAR